MFPTHPNTKFGSMEICCTTSFPPNLRYIQSTTDVTKRQTSLNISLARALHVYGDHTALLADTGVPPLHLIQYTHLAQFHFRLTKHILIPFLPLCLRPLTNHLPSITSIPLPSTTTFGTHCTNSTLSSRPPHRPSSPHDHLATEMPRTCLPQHTTHYY